MIRVVDWGWEEPGLLGFSRSITLKKGMIEQLLVWLMSCLPAVTKEPIVQQGVQVACEQLSPCLPGYSLHIHRSN